MPTAFDTILMRKDSGEGSVLVARGQEGIWEGRVQRSLVKMQILHEMKYYPALGCQKS